MLKSHGNSQPSSYPLSYGDPITSLLHPKGGMGEHIDLDLVNELSEEHSSVSSPTQQSGTLKKSRRTTHQTSMSSIKSIIQPSLDLFKSES